MNKHLLLTISFLVLTTLCQAFKLEPNQWVDFDGALGQTNIQLSLYRFENGQIRGNYCYKKYESKIQLIGKIKGNQVELTELLNGKPNGTFKGNISTDPSSDTFEGTWTNRSKTKTVVFKLNLTSITYGNYNHRYDYFKGTDDDVENFMKHVKRSILNDDKDWIASHIYYPLKTTLNGSKPITIKTKQQLIANFDKVFYKAFKDAIKTFCTCNLFYNDYGAMLGNGEIWINNTSNSTDKNYDYCISMVNN